MPKDIRIVWDANLMKGDFSFNSLLQDLESDEGIESAVVISVFTDRRAEIDDILPDPDNPDLRGWWGDLASPEVEGDQIGSRNWLFSREKTLASVLVRMKQYTEEALSWMIEDGVAVRVDVTTERIGPVGSDRLILSVSIYKVDGTKIALKYNAQWNAQALR